MRCRSFFLSVAFVALSVARVAAAERVFIHLTDNFKENDGPVCVAFNVAWGALREGHDVEIFFDQDATYGIKQWEAGKTDLGLYPLPEDLKDLLVGAFGVDRETIPSDYQEFLGFLSQQGASVTANGFWNALTKVENTIKGKENLLPFVEPLTLEELVDHRRTATVYLRF